MIHIEKDQVVPESTDLKVAAPTGDYEDSALIPVCDIHKPEEVTGSYQAQYIKYGGLVYRFNDPKDLGAAILKVDPDSTHMAASYVRMTEELLAQMNAGSLESDSLTQAMSDEQSNMQTPTQDTASTDAPDVPAPSAPEPLPQTNETPLLDASSTPVVPDAEVSSTASDVSTTTVPAAPDSPPTE